MNEPKISKIHIEYEDGSFDDIEMLPFPDFPLYDLRRKRAGVKKKNHGAIGGLSIGAFLLFTVWESVRRQFSEGDTLNLMNLKELISPPDPK